MAKGQTRTRLLALLAVLALVVAACGSDDAATTTTEAEATTTTTAGGDGGDTTTTAAPETTTTSAPEALSGQVRVLTFSTDQVPMDAAIAAFQEEFPEVEVDVDYGAVADVQATLQTQLAAGAGPDVFAVYSGAGATNSVLNIAPDGFVLDLSEKEWASKIPEADLEGISYEGTLYAAPLTAIGIGYLYNVQAMDEAGLQPPTTWDEVLAFCADAAAQDKVAYAVGYQTGWPTIMIPYALTATMLYRENPNFPFEMLDGNASFADSAWVDALQQQLDMLDAGCFNESPNGTTYEDQLAFVASGDALGSVTVQNSLPGIAQLAPEGTEFALAPFPANDDASTTYLSAGLLRALAINASTENQAAAEAFVDFLMREDNIAAFATAAGSLPAIPTPDYEAGPVAQTVLDFRASGQTAVIVDHFWPNPRVQQELIAGVQSMFAGDATPQDVAGSMDEAFAS